MKKNKIKKQNVFVYFFFSSIKSNLITTIFSPGRSWEVASQISFNQFMGHIILLHNEKTTKNPINTLSPVFNLTKLFPQDQSFFLRLFSFFPHEVPPFLPQGPPLLDGNNNDLLFLISSLFPLFSKTKRKSTCRFPSFYRPPRTPFSSRFFERNPPHSPQKQQKQSIPPYNSSCSSSFFCWTKTNNKKTCQHRPCEFWLCFYRTRLLVFFSPPLFLPSQHRPRPLSTTFWHLSPHGLPHPIPKKRWCP